MKRLFDRRWLWVGFAAFVLAIGAVRIPLQTVINPNDDAAIATDWLLNGQTSVLEDTQTRPFRWLLATPKDVVPALNHRLDLSILHATVALAQWAGLPVWQRTTFVLQHDVPALLRITGVVRTVLIPVEPTVRRFHLLLPYGFHPVQTRIEPLTTAAYDGYGFVGDQVLQQADDARPRIARWYGTTNETYLTPGMWIALLCCCVLPVLLAAWWWRGGDGLYPLLTAAIWLLPWLWASVHGQPWSIEPVTAAVVSIVCWAVLARFEPDVLPQTRFVIAGAAVGMTGMHAYATAQWMSGVDLAAFVDFRAFVTYLSGMRMAFPIPLLTAEFFLSRSGVPGLFSIGYLTLFCRIALLSGLLVALAPLWQTPRRLWIGVAVLACLVAGSGFVLRYYDRNVWMVYDALLGTSLVILNRLLRQSAAQSPRWWLLVGLTLAWLDSLRPFMMLFVPLIGVWMVLRARTVVPYRRMLWLALPLLPNLAWHAYHIGVLGQWSWSSHAGMNIARAWIPAAALDAMRAAPADMNSTAYLAASNALVAQTVAWIGAQPTAALLRGLELLAAMVTIPVEMARLNDGGVYTVITHPADPLVWGYRLVLAAALVLQLWCVVRGLRERAGWRQAHWLHAAVVVAIVGMSALTEYGEQARFLAAMVPALVAGNWEYALQLWHSRQEKRKIV